MSLKELLRVKASAESILKHQQRLLQQQTSSLSKAHMESILHTGYGITGYDNLMQQAYGEGSTQYKTFKETEQQHKETYEINRKMLYLPFDKMDKRLEKIKPASGDALYDKKLKVYEIMEKEIQKQKTKASIDPAEFVEQWFKENMPSTLSLTQRLLLRKELQKDKGIPSYSQRLLTNSERDTFLKRFKSDDPIELKKALDDLTSLKHEDYAIGNDILCELQHDAKELTPFVKGYMEQGVLNPKLADKFLDMIPLRKQLFSSITREEKKDLETKIQNNSDFKRWKTSFTTEQTHNLQKVENKYTQVLNLSRFYELEHNITGSVAVKRAIKELITEPYIYTTKDMYIPAQILNNGEIEQLNRTRVLNSLVECREAIINRKLPFDELSSFGQLPAKNIEDIEPLIDKYKKEVAERGEILPEKKTDFIQDLRETALKLRQNLLEYGQFRLSPDERSVYFTVQFEDGTTQPLMANKNEILMFPLSKLNKTKEELSYD